MFELWSWDAEPFGKNFFRDRAFSGEVEIPAKTVRSIDGEMLEYLGSNFDWFTFFLMRQRVPSRPMAVSYLKASWCSMSRSRFRW